MTREPLPLPEACRLALEAIASDPLAPGREAEAHLKGCPACAEARVLFLAQEEPPAVLAPAEYFDRLPARVLGKLPGRRLPLLQRLHGLAWMAAAALLVAVGLGAFLAGRANRTPLVEATLPNPSGVTDVVLTETPFRDRDEDAAQVQDLTPEEMQALLQRINQPAPAQR